MDDSAGVDIVGRAIAILDDEARSWAEQQGLRWPPERVEPSDDPTQGEPGG